jgi:hypothetical protein
MPNFSGLWTADQQYQAVGGSTWPSFPGAPTSVVATLTSGTAASVAFTAPSSAGFPASITGYIVTSSPDNITATGASSPISVTGLTTDTAYTFTVRAINASGTGPASAASNSVTPVNNFVEDVFSTFLYDGTSATNPINNGIDLSTKGGLVWGKRRNLGNSHFLIDTARGVGNRLESDGTGAQTDKSTSFTSFNSNGFTVATGDAEFNNSAGTYVSWTFRKQPKFFDIVTYTGTGTTAQNISHNLGAVPGCIIIKRTDSTSDWGVVHRSTNAYANYGFIGGKLNSSGIMAQTVTEDTGIYYTNSTTFQVDEGSAYFNPNASGGTYVAYLFAHDAGGFGTSGTDSVISCGTFTAASQTTFNINIGFEPQFLLVKNTGTTSDWYVIDIMRGFNSDANAGPQNKVLRPNTAGVEGAEEYYRPTATGIQGWHLSAGTYIYIAIRRGPMKVPTVGTTVFTPSTRAGTGGTATTSNLSFPPDMVWSKGRDNGGTNSGDFDRLRGATKQLSLNQADTETTASTSLTGFDLMTGYRAGADATQLTINATGYNYVNWQFRRAPGFFDQVCYTGTGANQTISHNLSVIPELIISKGRSNSGDWFTYVKLLDTSSNGNGKLRVNTTDPASDFVMLTTLPTSTNFIVSGSSSIAINARTYVAYLFATCAGVSKVGSYTGTGATQTIDCGFTAGSRFVMIKRSDTSGDWYIWDSARGIIPSNDPYLLLNSTAAEVTNTDYIDTYSAGFELSSTAPAALNASGGSYIFLAIA